MGEREREGRGEGGGTQRLGCKPKITATKDKFPPCPKLMETKETTVKRVCVCVCALRRRRRRLLTHVTVLSLPARLADAGPVVAVAVFFTARMARSLVARGANPALLTLALTLGANAVAATWHGAQLCRSGWGERKRGEQKLKIRQVGQ